MDVGYQLEAYGLESVLINQRKEGIERQATFSLSQLSNCHILDFEMAFIPSRRG